MKHTFNYNGYRDVYNKDCIEQLKSEQNQCWADHKFMDFLGKKGYGSQPKNIPTNLFICFCGEKVYVFEKDAETYSLVRDCNVVDDQKESDDELAKKSTLKSLREYVLNNLFMGSPDEDEDEDEDEEEKILDYCYEHNITVDDSIEQENDDPDNYLSLPSLIVDEEWEEQDD